MDGPGSHGSHGGHHETISHKADGLQSLKGSHAPGSGNAHGPSSFVWSIIVRAWVAFAKAVANRAVAMLSVWVPLHRLGSPEGELRLRRSLIEEENLPIEAQQQQRRALMLSDARVGKGRRRASKDPAALPRPGHPHQQTIEELHEELRKGGAPCLSGFSIQVSLRNVHCRCVTFLVPHSGLFRIPIFRLRLIC